jgi:hypothetical protein
VNLDAPASGRNFAVRVTRLGPRRGVRDEFELACRQVILPVMRVAKRSRPLLGGTLGRPLDGPPNGPPNGPPGDDAAHDGLDADDLLVLRRGHTGATELYDWWSTERSDVFRGSHNVEVVALADDGHAVTTWGFTGCHLVALRYSPLDAVDGDVLMETADVSFETVTQIGHRP